MSSERREPLLFLMGELRERGRRRGDTVSVRPGEVWIAFRSAQAGRIFAEVRPARKGLQAFLLPPRRELRDPRGFSAAAPESQGWGWFETKVTVAPSEVRALASLLVQSLDYARQLGPPRRGRRATQP